MKYNSRYAEKLAKRQKATKITRHVTVNTRGEIVGPTYGLDYRYDHITDKMVAHRDHTKPVFSKEIHAVPFSWEVE